MKEVIFILYVKEQEASKEFYEKVFEKKPTLNVPGMTEFKLTETTRLGLMPETGIKKILGDKVPPPESGSGIPRCELYLYVDEPGECLAKLSEARGKIISPVEKRNWGDYAGYGADLDGHIIGFAKKEN